MPAIAVRFRSAVAHRIRRAFGAALLALFPQVVSAETGLVTWTNFGAFHREAFGPGRVVLTSPEVPAGFPWKELIVSWNASTNVWISVEARPVLTPGVTFLSLGRWTANPDSDSPRESVNGQKESWGEVQTDVLVLKEPAAAAQVRLEIRGSEAGLKRIALAFSGDGVGMEKAKGAAKDGATSSGRGIELPVPIRSQAEYPEGVTRWCSPTSTTMLLAFWGESRGRGDWVSEVPDTAKAVLDPGWGGTGNWPFNMAFAGSRPGLNAVVARWDGIPFLERWVAAGMPAAASVSYALLKGRPAAESGDGHLVVVRGFTAEGDVVINDPGVRRERVRKVIPRADFDRGWAHSGRTVYLVWPDGQSLPEGHGYPR